MWIRDFIRPYKCLGIYGLNFVLVTITVTKELKLIIGDNGFKG
jgi:hypothetical protein